MHKRVFGGGQGKEIKHEGGIYRVKQYNYICIYGQTA